MLQKSSTKIIVLETTRGSFQDGFEVSIQISDRGKAVHQTLYGQLPPAPHIPDLYSKWQAVYLDDYFRIILPSTPQITNVASAEDRRNAGDALVAAMQAWLKQDSAKELEYALRDEIEHDESAQLVLKTQDELMQRLPWHRWSLFRRYEKLAMALHMPYPAQGRPLKWPVRILAILGNGEADAAMLDQISEGERGQPGGNQSGVTPSEGTQSGVSQSERSKSEETKAQAIDVQEDRRLIEALPRTEVRVLTQPTRRQFSDALRDRQGWDIVFFAGHSESRATSAVSGCPDGVIYINEQDALSLKEFNQALKAAIAGGLQLLILNSCDGLGIARSIAEVRLPYTVVMREPVPDPVAHAFLRYFLESFSNGEPLHRSLRIARDRLDEGLKKEFPSASWLPIVCQHPSAPLLCWPSITQAPSKLKWGLAAGMVGLAAIAGIVGHKLMSIDDAAFITPAVEPLPLQWEGDSPHLPGFELDMSQGSKALMRPAPLNPADEQSLDQKELGTVAYALGEFDEAIAHFKKALKIKPNSPEALIYKNNAQNQLQRKANTVILGVPLPMTADPNAALEIMRGVAQAQEEINQEGGIQAGLKKLRFQILLIDDGDDPDTAERIAVDLSQKPEVIAVIGSNTSDSSLATLKTYQDGEMPVISPTSTSVDLSLEDTFFRTVPHDGVAATALADYAHRQGLKRAVAYYNPDSLYSQSLEAAFRQKFERLEGEIVREVDMVSVNFKPGPSLEAAQQQNAADFVALFPNHTVLERAAQVLLANQDLGKLPILGGDGLYSPKIPDLARSSAIGSVVSVPWHIENSPDPKFPKTSRKLWNEAEVNWRSATAYDAVLAIAQAIRNRQATRTGIYEALRDPQFQFCGASGLVQFDAMGDRNAANQLVQVIWDQQKNRSKFSPISTQTAKTETGC